MDVLQAYFAKQFRYSITIHNTNEKKSKHWISTHFFDQMHRDAGTRTLMLRTDLLTGNHFVVNQKIKITIQLSV